jgi:hypothetical protein
MEEVERRREQPPRRENRVGDPHGCGKVEQRMEQLPGAAVEGSNSRSRNPHPALKTREALRKLQKRIFPSPCRKRIGAYSEPPR